MAEHNFEVKGKHEGGSGMDVQRCKRCGLEIWPGSLRKEVAGGKLELPCVPPQAEIIRRIPCDPAWPASAQDGWLRL